MKEYQVVLIDKSPKNDDEILDLFSWEKANCLTDFCSPWKKNSFSKTEFRVLWDSENLYFNFRVFDTDICIDQKDDSNHSIGNSDRVELFFRTNETLNPYYCLEMDTTGRIMDFEARPNKNFDFNWKWPKDDIKLKTSNDKTSFTVEGKISIESLENLNLIRDNTIETGVYRAKFFKTEDNKYEPIWISWVNPKTEIPNFHTASSFGKFILMK